MLLVEIDFPVFLLLVGRDWLLFCLKDVGSNSRSALWSPFSSLMVFWCLSHYEVWKPIPVDPLAFTVMCLQLRARRLLDLPPS